MKKTTCIRGLIYVSGVSILALGVTLSTKTGLGISPITSMPFAISQASGISMSVMVFIVYVAMLGLQFLIRGKGRRWRDLLQIPLSLVFSSFLEWFETLFDLHFDLLWQNLALLALAIVLCGIGISMMVNMQVVPNPPDGLAQTMSEVWKKEMGLVKNLLDFTCVAISVAVDLLFGGRLVSVGLGTVLAMLFIGRTVALFNRFFKEKLLRAAGLSQ